MDYYDDSVDSQWLSLCQLYDHITQLSLEKLEQSERSRTEPGLRRQVLVRNILTTRLPETHLRRTQEQVWLNACFDQLDDDDLMHSDHQDHVSQQDHSDDNSVEHAYLTPGNQKLVFAVSLDYLARSTEQTTPPKNKSPLALLEWSW